jgi:hypothetical protein
VFCHVLARKAADRGMFRTRRSAVAAPPTAAAAASMEPQLGELLLVHFKMMDQSGHKSIDMLRGYIRDAELFKDHAGTGLL